MSKPRPGTGITQDAVEKRVSALHDAYARDGFTSDPSFKDLYTASRNLYNDTRGDRKMIAKTMRTLGMEASASMVARVRAIMEADKTRSMESLPPLALKPFSPHDPDTLWDKYNLQNRGSLDILERSHKAVCGKSSTERKRIKGSKDQRTDSRTGVNGARRPRHTQGRPWQTP